MNKELNEQETILIFRALMILSYVVETKDKHNKCQELARYFVSDFEASKMLNEELHESK